MRLIIIAALSRNRVIGKNGKIPWHISEDLKRFKRITSGHTVLMGRKTFESLGKPLPNRRNVVLTSRQIPGIETYDTLDKALHALKNEDKVFLIGGGEIFAQALERVDEMYLTLVDRDVEGDVYFPEYRHLIGKRFREVNRESHEGFTFANYVRM
jgi:dihydrofolate reductase